MRRWSEGGVAKTGCLSLAGAGLLGVFFALLLMEAAVRLFLPQSGRPQYLPDPVVGYRHRPDQELWVSDESLEFRAWFSTNAHGDPDRERSLEKGEGVYRIAVVGDSMVESAQVARSERFTELLEGALSEETGLQVEVLNFGTSGYSTAQEWLYYREHVRSFRPDLVLLVFLPGNDIKNNSYHLEVERSCRPETSPFFTLAEAGALVLENEGFYERTQARFEAASRRSLGERLRLLNLAQRAYAAIRSGSVGSERAAMLDQDACQTRATLELFDPRLQDRDPSWRQAWEVTAALLEQFSLDVAADGAGFLVAVATGPWEVQPETRRYVLELEDEEHYDWELPHRMAGEMLSELGLGHFLLLPGLKERADEAGDAIHFQYNGHYTAFGHRLVAEALLPEVLSILSRE